MDKCSSDADFDSYWEYESRNKNRNRIRVGRQYQATIPALLKPGEIDGRKCEDLETLKWKPDSLSDSEVEHYLSMAKAVGLFAKAIDTCRVPEKAADKSLQTALKGLSEFVTSHHPCHHDDGCQVPSPALPGESSPKCSLGNEWTPAEAQLFAQALEACGKNFCAIKKDFLPWKPVRSIIEYYYQGKSDKTDSITCSTEASESSCSKMEPVASCSHNSNKSDEQLETKTNDIEPDDMDEKEDVKSQSEGSEAVECSKEKPITSKSTDLQVSSDLSTVGSLKFYLGGRLVLKLNAQQDSGSANKCQWVQSNDTPKLPTSTKKMKHRKKGICQDHSLEVIYEDQKHKKKEEASGLSTVEACDTVTVKKAKLKSDSSSLLEAGTSFSLLYSTSWTPPVADGPDAVEMDDGSSKTSEGYVSPVLLSSRAKTEVKCDISSSAGSISVGAKTNDINDSNEKKYDPQNSLWIKTELSSSPFASHSHDNSHDESLSQSQLGFRSEKSSSKLFGKTDPACSQEVLCHKSALTHCKTQVKGMPCTLPKNAHSCSPSLQQWSRQSVNVHHPERVKSSPGFPSPKSSVINVFQDSHKDTPLDLTVKPDARNSSSQLKEVSSVASNTIFKTGDKINDKNCSFEENVHISDNDKNFLADSKSSTDSVEPLKDMQASSVISKTMTSECSEYQNAVVTEYPGGKSIPENMKSETDMDISDLAKAIGDSKNPGHFSYSYYNLPCSCTSPDCTESKSLKDPMCNKDDKMECPKDSTNRYLVPMTEDTNSTKPPPWFGASYLQFYQQCYPYYLAYSVPAAAVTTSSVTEIPLDLSSPCEDIKNEKPIPNEVPEKQAEVSRQSAEALERGMLYQLLKNKATK